MDFLTEVELIYQFLFEKELGWRKDILAFHPRLQKVYSLKNKSSRTDIIKNYLTDFRKKEGGRLKEQKKLYRREWKKIEKKAFNVLSESIETDWPKSRNKIKAMVSVNPICPRFLDDWSFSIFYKLDAQKAKEVILHESCHFLYFEKWKEIFPGTKRRTLECPYVEWHLSEILALIILNDQRIQKLLKHKADFYKEHQNLTINGTTLPKYFSLLYKKYTDKNYSFEQFLKKAYSEIKKHRIIFSKL